MKIRRRALPPGWYPSSGEGIRDFIEGLAAETEDPVAVACVAPHAGWAFSGAIAYKALSSLKKDAQSILVCGGHLPPSYSPLMAMEEAVETPLGPMEIDGEFRSLLLKQFPFGEDRYGDNTVEVLLPMVKYLFPESRVLWLRCPASILSYRIGTSLSEIASQLNRSIVVIGSTDLTHYGPNYEFIPHGAGKEAQNWVRDVNDKAFLDALVEGDADTTLLRGERDSAACSSGAVLAAMAYAKGMHCSKARIIQYGSSADIAPASSFVSYAAISWSA